MSRMKSGTAFTTQLGSSSAAHLSTTPTVNVFYVGYSAVTPVMATRALDKKADVNFKPVDEVGKLIASMKTTQKHQPKNLIMIHVCPKTMTEEDVKKIDKEINDEKMQNIVFAFNDNAEHSTTLPRINYDQLTRMDNITYTEICKPAEKPKQKRIFSGALFSLFG